MNELTAKIEQDLKVILNNQFPENGTKDSIYKEVYEYALLPAGKLFRSQLIWCVFGDLLNHQMKTTQTIISPCHQLLSAAIECHHAYTLVHDDMPCMDNDEFRRGKLATHKKYGEWKALLIGDGLLNMSYQILSEIKHQNALNLINLFSRSCGHQGLIYGQFLDLNIKSSPSTFENIKNIHKLKTGKLFECAMMGSYLLTDINDQKREEQLKVVSKSIGELFQFLDDLTELHDINISGHEGEINPWVSFYDETFNETINLLSETTQNLENFPQTSEAIKKYYQKIRLYLLANKPEVLRFIEKKDLEPLILALE
tara:strand:- start:4180 stop:5118 length:939 start_codon:yes stop_codon:yes gene_type:complete